MRNICINANNTEQKIQQRITARKRFSLIQVYIAVPANTPFNALNTAKYAIAVNDKPHHIAPVLRNIPKYRNEKSIRDNHITIVPKMNAISTDNRIAEITPIARVVLINPPSEPSVSEGSPEILNNETAIAAPNKLKTNATVVDVGKPNEL